MRCYETSFALYTFESLLIFKMIQIMKKRNLKSLSLNKKSISDLDLNNTKGGLPLTIHIRVSWAVCPTPLDIATKLLDCN